MLVILALWVLLNARLREFYLCNENNWIHEISSRPLMGIKRTIDRLPAFLVSSTYYDALRRVLRPKIDSEKKMRKERIINRKKKEKSTQRLHLWRVWPKCKKLSHSPVPKQHDVSTVSNSNLSVPLPLASAQRVIRVIFFTTNMLSEIKWFKKTLCQN